MHSYAESKVENLVLSGVVEQLFCGCKEPIRIEKKGEKPVCSDCGGELD